MSDKTKVVSSRIGGQAVLEGVMMRNMSAVGTAVRTPEGKIAVNVEHIGAGREDNKLLKLPIIRGVVSFFDSLYIGTKALTYSASFYDDEEDDKNKKAAKTNGEGIVETKKYESTAEDIITVIISVVLALVVFGMLPFYLSNLLASKIPSKTIILLIEGFIRIGIFIAYILLISQMKDIKRTFMYHGAEHKCINCLETGHELTVANVRAASRYHKRCGTSFLIFVMLITFVVFMFIRVDTLWLRYVLRILLIPVIAGIAYEFIRYAGSHEGILVRIISKPGFWMQMLTTKEPDDKMIEVGMAAVNSVFNWKAYLADVKSGRKLSAIEMKINYPAIKNKSEGLNSFSKDELSGKAGDSFVIDSVAQMMGKEKQVAAGASLEEDNQNKKSKKKKKNKNKKFNQTQGNASSAKKNTANGSAKKSDDILSNLDRKFAAAHVNENTLIKPWEQKKIAEEAAEKAAKENAPEVKVEVNTAEVKTEEVKSEVKADAKTDEVKSEPKADAKTEEVKSKVKADAKTEEVKPEAKIEPRNERLERIAEAEEARKRAALKLLQENHEEENMPTDDISKAFDRVFSYTGNKTIVEMSGIDAVVNDAGQKLAEEKKNKK